MFKIPFISLFFIVAASEAFAKKIFFSDGEYEGSTKRGEPHGKGEMRYKTGKVYSGHWIKGKAHGDGRLIKKNGSFYNGKWIRGKFQSGMIVGIFSSGDKCNVTFNREDTEAVPTSYTCNFVNGDVFVGLLDLQPDELVKGLDTSFMHGNGTLKKASGDTYEGPIRNGKADGFGEYLDTKTKNRFIGFFKSGVKLGEGTMFFSDGTKFAGNWSNGTPIGDGTHSDSSGTTHIGPYDERSLALKMFQSGIAVIDSDQQILPSEKTEPDCKGFSYDLMVIIDSWGEMGFNLNRGVSSCTNL